MLFLKYLGFFQVMPNSQIQAIQNLGTALITMGAGSIVDEYAKYKKNEFQRTCQAKTRNLLSQIQIQISGMATTG